jgi:rod shape-determining protein MreD
MIRELLLYPLSFIVFVAVQVLVLNNIQFSGYVNPFLYILFILWLPINIPNWLLMLVAAFLGLVVDVFSNTLGMHMSACIFLAFCRPFVLRILAPRDGYEGNMNPSIQGFGWTWFLSYITLSTILHHLFLFFVEVFRFSEAFDTIGRSFASSFFTLLLILITQLFYHNVEDRK